MRAKELTREGTNYNLEFFLLENKQPYTPEAKRYDLYIVETFHILYGGHTNLLNSKTEITNKCRHRSKYKLGASP